MRATAHGSKRISVIVMAGRPEDLVAEAYASVFLVASGFA
jgi:hypothetical protein